ncbi:DUF4296 domain-containing protein [Ornithobacterium rhinotracheale]|uniref:DUF4296 domain-containing protein n=1 Tax=Ornithobacterium rhinotracheale TaxID=28251 RepID=UPI004035776C
MKKLIFAIFSLMILACNHGIEKPDNLVDRDTFKSILTQMYLYKQAPTVSVARDIDFNVINATILANHHVSAEDFKNSLEYYMVDRGQYEEILKEIQDSIHNQIDRPTEEESVPAVDKKTIAPNE